MNRRLSCPLSPAVLKLLTLLLCMQVLAGTSTGCWIACLLACGLEPSKVLDFYCKFVPRFFEENPLPAWANHLLNALWRLLTNTAPFCKYRTTNLETAADAVFGDLCLDDLSKYTLLLSSKGGRSQLHHTVVPCHSGDKSVADCCIISSSVAGEFPSFYGQNASQDDIVQMGLVTVSLVLMEWNFLKKDVAVLMFATEPHVPSDSWHIDLVPSENQFCIHCDQEFELELQFQKACHFLEKLGLERAAQDSNQLPGNGQHDSQETHAQIDSRSCLLPLISDVIGKAGQDKESRVKLDSEMSATGSIQPPSTLSKVGAEHIQHLSPAGPVHAPDSCTASATHERMFTGSEDDDFSTPLASVHVSDDEGVHPSLRKLEEYMNSTSRMKSTARLTEERSNERRQASRGELSEGWGHEDSTRTKPIAAVGDFEDDWPVELSEQQLREQTARLEKNLRSAEPEGRQKEKLLEAFILHQQALGFIHVNARQTLDILQKLCSKNWHVCIRICSPEKVK